MSQVRGRRRPRTMSTTYAPIPAGRMQLAELAPRPYAALVRLSQALHVDPTVKELVAVRGAQLNGCAFCLDMHTKDARHHGETEERLALVAAWREATCFDDRERAALALAEAITLVGESHVPDDVHDEAARHFAPEELAQLVLHIGVGNLWNRLQVTARVEPGHYRPGMFG